MISDIPAGDRENDNLFYSVFRRGSKRPLRWLVVWQSQRQKLRERRPSTCCLPSLLGKGDEGIDIVYGEEKYFVLGRLHCQKRLAVFPEIIKLFPVRESLVSDIPAGDRKNDNLFYSVLRRGSKRPLRWQVVSESQRYILRDRRPSTAACPACWAKRTKELT